MTKIPYIIFSTDWHLKKDNLAQITDLVIQKCKLAVSLGVKKLGVLGDIFDSRVAQTQDNLNTFGVILDIIHSYGLELLAFPGNHDKTSYTSYNSFLDPFEGRSWFKLYKYYEVFTDFDHEIRLAFLPFFEEEMWVNEFNSLMVDLEQMPEKYKIILCTHIAITGSRNNDGKYVSSTISSGMFKPFHKVLSGHYHDQQKIGDNFHHIPSIQQNNFGENPDKGFTVLYTDGSIELVKSYFPEFLKVSIDLETNSREDIDLLRRQYQDSKDNIRFEFIGSETALKSIKKEELIAYGIDVKTKVKEIQDDIIFAETEEVVEHTKSSLLEEFEKFCVKEELNFETGVKFLNCRL